MAEVDQRTKAYQGEIKQILEAPEPLKPPIGLEIITVSDVGGLSDELWKQINLLLQVVPQKKKSKKRGLMVSVEPRDRENFNKDANFIASSLFKKYIENDEIIKGIFQSTDKKYNFYNLSLEEAYIEIGQRTAAQLGQGAGKPKHDNRARLQEFFRTYDKKRFL